MGRNLPAYHKDRQNEFSVSTPRALAFYLLFVWKFEHVKAFHIMPQLLGYKGLK